jgi:Na+/melibiose symporter-like transporter
VRTVLGTRGAPWLLGAGLVSLTGDWVLRIGLGYWIYTLTHSTVATALALLASFVPQTLVGSVAGVFVDRWSPRRTMVVSNLGLAAGLLPLLLVRSPGTSWLVFLVLAWEGVIQQFFAPAEQKAVPLLVDSEQLLRVNALNSQNRDLSRLIGSAIGGTVVAVLGIAAVVAIDAGSFVIAAAMITRLRLAPHPVSVDARDSKVSERLRTLRAEWSDGIRVLASTRVLRAMLIFIAITSVGEGTMGALFAPFVRSELHGSGTDYGIINSLQAVGGIAGALTVTALGDRLEPGVLLGRAALAFGFIDLAIFLYPLIAHTVWPAEVLMVIVGVPGAFIVACSMTLLQRHTADRHRGRVFGALGAVEGIAVVVGTAAAGVLAQSIGIVPVLVTQGAGYVLAASLVGALHIDRRPVLAQQL